MGIAGVEFQQVVRLHARGCIGLNHHALQAPLVREVVDIAGAQSSGQRRVDRIEGDAQCVGLVAVDVDLQLRGILQPVWPHLRQHLALRGHAQQLVACIDKCLMACAAAVLQAEGEAAGITQLRDGRWAQGEDKCIANAG